MNISEELKRRLEERKSNSTTKITTETKKQSSNSSAADILKNRLGQRKAITEFGLDTLSSDISTLSTTIDKAYNGWQSQETMKNTLSSVQSMYDRLGQYQEFAKQYGGTDLSELRDAYKGVLDNWDDLSKKYKGYSNAKEYDKAIKSAEALDKKMRTADIGKLETEITDLEKIFNVAKEYDSKAVDFSKQSMNMRNPSAIKPFSDTLNKLNADRDNYLKSVGYTSMDELEKALGEKKVFKTNAERMQNLIKLSSVGDINAENYDKDYNKYVKSGKSVSVDDIGTTTEVRAGRGRRKVGKTVNSLEKEVALAYERRQNGEKSSASDTWANDKGALYDKMTDKEFDDFFYYYAKDMEDGGNRTEEYMNAIADTLNSRRGEDISKSVGDSTWGEARFAITSGLNQWMQGYMGNFAGEEYTPTSPIQYASGMVRENVEEDYGKFARTMYDLGVTGANQLPSILVSTMMNYATGGAYAAGTMGAKVMSGISKGAGLATMYGSARGNAYTEMLNLGYDKDQATTYANLVGASEVGLQALIGGISKLGGTSGMVDDFVKGIDNAFARFAIKYPLAMASETTEEGLQEVLNPLFQNIAAGYDTGAKVDWGEVAYSALLGGLMGGMFEGPGLAVESVAEHLGDKRIGQTIKSNERVGDLFDLADNPEIKSAYDTYTRWANKGITADNVSDAKLGRLYSNARLDAQETIESKTSTDEQKASAHKILDNLDIYTQSSIESRTGSAQNIDKKFLKTFTDEDIKLQIDSSLEMDEDSEAYKIASKLQEKMNKGKKVTTTELASLMEATDNAVKADEYKDISTQIVEKGGGEELAKIVARKLRGETLTSEESKMVLESAIVPEVIGENTNAENQTSEILEKAKSMDNKAEASIFLAQYDGKTDVEAYTNAFNLVATKTRDNFTLAEVLNHKSVLSKTQVNAIYNELRIKPDKMKRFEYQKLSERTANLKFYKGAINDSVIDYTNRSTDAKEYRANPTGKVNWNSLTDEQRKSIVFFKGLAKGIGLRLNLVVDGEAEGFNGKFQISNNTITVDIFAEHEVIDDEVTKRMMVDSLVPTMSHELTHWMEQKSPELYRQICDIVFPTLQRRDGLTESERIAKEIRSMLEDEYKGKPIPAEVLSEALTDSDRIKDARSEIVARACEDMLSQSKVGKEMFNSLSKQEQKTLVEKIKDIIKDFLNWIDEALSFYKSTSYEAGILRDFQEEANKISALWDKMLTDSAEVNQALEKSNAFKTFADDIYNSLVKDKQYEGYVIKDTHYSTTDDSAKFILAKPDGTSITGSVGWNPASNEDVVSKRVAQIIAEELSAKVDTTSIGSRDMSELSKAVDTNGKSLFQYRAMVEDEDIYRAMLLKHKESIGITDNQITELFNTIDKAINIIENNLEALDYAWEADIDARAFSPIKPNSDSLYKVSLDFSTLCRKRLLQQTIARTLQNALDKNLSTEESIAIRDELMKVQEEGRKIEIACALCYVESARMKSPKQINKFLNNREASIREFFANKSGGSIKEKIANAEMKARKELAKKYPDGLPGKNNTILDALTAPKSHMIKSDADYIREEGKKAKASYKLTEHEQAELDAALKMSIDDFTSAKGLENLAKNHPDIFDAYTSFVRNATHSKGIENDTWWRAGDAESIGDALIANMNAENGLRSQSWSDFQVIHLLDYIAATIELSTKGAKRQSYTKVPDYVKLLGNTGDMINMSLIPESVFNGKLSYDSVEGMAYEIAKQLRDEYHETAGTICIGINNEQIKLLLEDTTIDMVIPYHHSSMSKAVRKLMHIPAWETYQNYQGEKKLSETEAKANAKKYGVKLNADANYQKAPKFSEWFNLEEARQIAKMENEHPSNQEAFKKYGKMYGGYMAMQNAANKYLKLCAERGLAPKFSNEKADFTQDANYWKLLIDRKMVDNVTGEIVEQKAIKPIFNEKSVLEILNDELARYPEVKADQEYAHRKVVEKFLSGDMKVDKSTMEAIKKPIDNVTKVNIFESTRKTDVLKASRKNPNLTDEDLNDYMRTGKTLHTRNKKQRMLESGKKPILTSSVETKEFISDAIKGKAPGEIRAFKKVGERLSNAINEKRSSLYMINKYLELNADDLRESYKRHSSPKEKGDIPLTEEDFENIPELVDEFDDVLGINTYNNKTEVHLYKETEEGYIRILTVVSSERNSLQVTKLIGVSKEKFEAKYTKKIEGNIGSPKSLIEDSNQSTTARLTADVPSTESVSPSGKNVKENFSDTDSEGKTLTKAQVVSDLSKLPADELLREFSNLALDVRSGLEKPSRHSESKLVEDKTKFVQYGDYIIEHIDEYTPDRLWVASQGIVYADIDRKIFTREHFIDVVQPKIDEIKKSLGYQNDAPESYDAGMENVIRSFFANELGFKDASPENSKDIDNDAKDPWDDILYSKRNNTNSNKMYSLKDEINSLPAEDKEIVLEARRWAMYSSGIATMSEDRLSEAYNEYSHSTPTTTNGYLAYIEPYDFIYLTTTNTEAFLENNPQRLNEGVSEQWGTENNIQKSGPLYLSINEDGKVIGHEGRHRMAGLLREGVDKVAVVIKTDRVDNAKPISIKKLLGQDFTDTRNYKSIYIHNMLPISKEYENINRHVFGDVTERSAFIETNIRYSKRTTTSVYDILGESETKRLHKENEKLNADASKLKNIIGTEEVANRRFLGLANYIKKLSGSTMDSAKLANILKDTYTSMQKAKSFSWGFIAEQTQGIAEMVMSNDMGVSSEYFKRVMTEIRKDKISLSEEQRARMEERFGNYGNFHKYVFGRANITKDGTPLETVWKSWAEKYPSLFDKNVSGAEQIDALVEAVDALKATSSIMGEYEHQEAIRHLSTEIYNQFWNIAADTSTSDDTQSVRSEHKALMTELRKDYEQRQKSLTSHPTGETVLKYENLLKKVKETKRKEIARAKEHGKEMLGKYKENAERKTKIQSITSNSLSLNEMLLKNSKDKHIPEILKGPVTSLLQAIDFSSKRLVDGGEATQKDISLSKALGKVKDMMVKATNAHEELVELYGHGLDEDIERLVDNVDTIMRMVGDNEFIINKMSLEDLQTLDKMVKTIKHAVNKLNKFHTVNHAKGIANLSVESVSYLNSLGKAKVYDGLKGKTQKLLDWNNALPYYVFKRFGSGAMKVYEALQDGWDKFAFNTKQILDYADEAYTSKEVNEWSEEIKTFKIVIPANEFELADPDYTPQYQEVQLTVPQIMSMYCLNKREQARGHLFQGGIRVADFKTKKGEVISQSEGVIFTEKDISTILNSLTDRQRAVADKLQEFMNTISTDWGNEVSMARFGYKAFGEPNYFPIQSDDNNLSVNDATEQANSLFRLLNMSFTKSTVEKANNRIVISDIFDVFAQHTSDMAKYNALALPVLDAFKWYNFTEKQDVAEGTFKTIGVKQAIENAFGKDGKSYFTTFLKDINGQKEVSRDTLGKGFFTKAKIAAVGANLRVVALQPTSYLRASAVIDTKYLLKASAYIKVEPIGMVKKLKKSIANAEKYCGMALWKSMGYYDTNIQKGLEAQIKHANTWKDKATEWSMKGAEIADKVTWGCLWTACELEIRDTRTDLKVGSKEFYEAIGKRLREVIYATQVVDSTMTRSQMMRSSNDYDKMLTAFASEPTLSYNMLQDAFMQYKLDARQMGKKEARVKNAKRIGRILYAYTMTNAIAALVESAFDALREDDDEEMDMIAFLKMYFKNFALDMSIGNKIPYVKEMYSLLQGFSSSRTDTQWMEELTRSLTTWYKIFNGKSHPSTAIKYSIKTISTFTGLPFYNVYRDLMATLNKLDLFTEEDLNEMFGDFED